MANHVAAQQAVQKQHAAEVRNRSDAGASWTTTLSRVYAAFGRATHPDAILAVLAATPRVYRVEYAGLEQSHAIPLVAVDAALRRRELYDTVQRHYQRQRHQQQQVQRQQQQHQRDACNDNDSAVEAVAAYELDVQLQRACRRISRPSKLYARHVADLAASAVDPDQGYM